MITPLSLFLCGDEMILVIKRGVWETLSDFGKKAMNFMPGDKLHLHWKEMKTVKKQKVLVDMDETIRVPDKYLGGI